MGFLRKQLGLILRILFSGLLLSFLVHNKENLYKCGGYFQHARPGWLLAGFVLLGMTMVLGTYRWRILLHIQGIDLSYSKLFPMNMIGQFFSTFLLGVTGGDVMKIYYVTYATPEKRSAAGLSVIYDRILGLLGIMVWGLCFTATRYSFLTSSPNTRRCVLAFLLICAAAVGGIVFALCLPWIRRNSGLWKLEQKLPFHRTLENLSDAFERYAKSPLQNLIVLGISVFIHGCLFLAMYMVARAIDLPASFLKVAAITSIVNVLIAVPISISGLGFREQLYVFFLALINISAPQAMAFSLMGWGLNVVWGLLGGCFFMRYKKHAPSSSPVLVGQESDSDIKAVSWPPHSISDS